MTGEHGLLRAGIVLGLGFGGFADGIVLHQILAWHHLVCITTYCQPYTIEHLQQQNRQDGFFHLTLLLISVLGVVLLFRSARKQADVWTGRAFCGAMLVGWGLFNVVEGLIDHHVLGIHHVLPGHPQQLLWDMLFLVAGLLYCGVGWALIKCERGKALFPVLSQVDVEKPIPVTSVSS